jgi:ABC-type transporter Mla subunit MlaD
VDSPSESLIDEAARGLSAVGRIQESFDAVAWQVSEPLAKLRHVILHLNKALGELASVAEQLDHSSDAGAQVSALEVADSLRSVEHRLGDLVMFTAQFANLCHDDLGDVWSDRLRSILTTRVEDAQLTATFIRVADRQRSERTQQVP